MKSALRFYDEAAHKFINSCISCVRVYIYMCVCVCVCVYYIEIGSI